MGFFSPLLSFPFVLEAKERLIQSVSHGIIVGLGKLYPDIWHGSCVTQAPCQFSLKAVSRRRGSSRLRHYPSTRPALSRGRLCASRGHPGEQIKE